jgi:hypothetical protein
VALPKPEAVILHQRLTEALHLLEGVAIVKAGRGHVEVLDREKLEEIAGACYGVPEREYRRLIG